MLGSETTNIENWKQHKLLVGHQSGASLSYFFPLSTRLPSHSSREPQTLPVSTGALTTSTLRRRDSTTTS